MLGKSRFRFFKILGILNKMVENEVDKWFKKLGLYYFVKNFGIF